MKRGMSYRHQEKEEDVLDMVPEKGWRDRTSVVSTLPSDIKRDFIEVRKRFGLDIANLILLTYREWGPKTARALARRILSFPSFEDLISFLEKKFELFNERSRKILSELIYSYQYNYNFSKLLDIISKHEKNCPNLREMSTKIFHCFASKGMFYYPECIVSYVMVKQGCRKGYNQRCKNTIKSMKNLHTCLVGDENT